MKIRISSRQSELAQAQAYHVGEELQKSDPKIEIEYLFRESLGDKNLQDPLWKMPEKGVFTEDFYRDLVDEKTDLVVHSWKDLPTEEKPDTFIAATTERADQRDLLLFKKSSHGKKNVRLFSSSPRRTLNLKEFLAEALPWDTSEIDFQSVRGNIPTRIRKLLAEPNIDGLVLAKAALDRLLSGSRFPETQKELREAIGNTLWMVLPLTANPNAAAQGALAIEIKRGRSEIENLLKKIHSESTFLTAQRERDLLRAHGGGCHLALGMSCLGRAYGQIEIVRGIDPSGKKVQTQKFFPTKKIPSGISRQRLKFETHRTPLDLPDLSGVNALLVSKAEAWIPGLHFDGLVWTSGVETWKKLARLGVWVSGSSEGLGESEDPNLEVLISGSPAWGRLGHDSASTSGDKIHFATYRLDLSLLSRDIKAEGAFVWKSPQEFDLAVDSNPTIRSQIHICGPGRTYQALAQKLGTEDQLFVELSDEFQTVL